MLIAKKSNSGFYGKYRNLSENIESDYHLFTIIICGMIHVINPTLE